MSPSPMRTCPSCKHCNINFKSKEVLVEHIKTKHNQPGMNLTASQRTLLLPSPGFMAAMEKSSEDESTPNINSSKAKKVVDIWGKKL